MFIAITKEQIFSWFWPILFIKVRLPSFFIVLSRLPLSLSPSPPLPPFCCICARGVTWRSPWGHVSRCGQMQDPFWFLTHHLCHTCTVHLSSQKAPLLPAHRTVKKKRFLRLFSGHFWLDKSREQSWLGKRAINASTRCCQSSRALNGYNKK